MSQELYIKISDNKKPFSTILAEKDFKKDRSILAVWRVTHSKCMLHSSDKGPTVKFLQYVGVFVLNGPMCCA